MYIILPSNTPAFAFPENKSSNFTTPLPHILLTRGWKVGLAQIQLPITFYNVEADFRIHFETDEETISVHLQDGIYETPAQMISMLAACCGEQMSVTWDNGFNLTLGDRVKTVVLDTKLSRLLGVPTKITDKTFASLASTFDPWINLRLILVQCSLSTLSQVNDSQLPILRAIVIQNFNFGHTFCGNFHPIDFLDVQGEAHKTITIQLTDLDNDLIRFRSGSVVLQLALQENEI